MLIYIPTIHRQHRQITLRNLPEAWLPHVTLVTLEEQAQSYADAFPEVRVVAQPEGCKGIAAARQFMVEDCRAQGHDRIMMFDDDLRFYQRTDPSSVRLSTMNGDAMLPLWDDVEKALEEYAHVGISPREYNNAFPVDSAVVRRMMRAIMYRVDVLEDLGLSFDVGYDRFSMDDFNMTLALLRRGFANLVFYKYAQNQDQGSDTEGGASTWRADESQSRSAHMLAELHPGFVEVVKKTTLQSWGGRTRDDVKVQWRKAYDAADLQAKE